jgi:hypothetical protein
MRFALRMSAANLAVVLAAGLADAQGVARGGAGDCVTLGAPKPAVTYTYVRSEPRGASVEYSNQWEQVTSAGSRVRTERAGRGGGTSSNVSRHRIENDISIIEQTTSNGTDARGTFSSTTTFTPGIVGDPFGRACAGRSWPIAAVSATNRSVRGTFTTKSDAGELKMLGLRETITVPAGTFETIHYARITTSPRGTITDEYWKSIEHGVTVKHESRLMGLTTTEVLQSIR